MVVHSRHDETTLSPVASSRRSRAHVIAGLVALVAGCTTLNPPRATPSPPPASAPAELGSLPASFAGELPCSDCAGVRTQLDLWPDGVFHLQRAYVGKPGRDDDRGRWRRVPEKDVVLLYGGREMPLSFEWSSSESLAPLDALGRPVGDGTAALRRLDAFAPAELQLSLHGMFRYMADAARFEECLTGRSYPVAMEGDFVAIETAYRESSVGGTGQPIMASFDGEIALRPGTDGGGATSTVVVRRFVGLWPGATCERAMSRASLADTYWRMVRLHGQPLTTPPGQREAHLVLYSQGGRYRGHFGCAGFAGLYSVEGDGIAFEAPEFTATGACSTADRAEIPAAAQWRTALADARRWTVNAQVLEWFDASGRSIAVFEAVYFR